MFMSKISFFDDTNYTAMAPLKNMSKAFGLFRLLYFQHASTMYAAACALL